MTADLFTDPAQDPSEHDDAPAPVTPLKAALPPELARRAALLQGLTLQLGLDHIDRTIQGVHQDGRDPDDATYTLLLDDDTRVTLGTISTLMSRPKVQQALLVRLGVSATPMKSTEWQDAIATIIAGATDLVTTQEAISSRAVDWADQYLEQQRPSPDIDAACIAREPYIDPEKRIHLSISKLAKFVARTTTEQITERKLASALRDAGWTQHQLNYYPAGRDQAGKGNGPRSTASYWRKP